ncbi:MAG: DUF1592 domain-containing protein, partial [Verrucomicrobia bacterium]|nr:DUF1592 domain-containing protein [Verrucomicrobiota bacterium]
LRPAGFLALLTTLTVTALAAATRPAPADASLAGFLGAYCLDCHSRDLRKGRLNLEAVDPSDPAAHPALWEKVLRKLDHRQMPPLGEARPDEAAYQRTVTALTAQLDAAAHARPDPGRTATFRRLNRTEYQQAIRDLLAVEIDATDLLPNDEPSHGFDNVAVGNLSPTLLDRYVTAAQRIARLAVGRPPKAPAGDTFRVRADVTQEEHVPGLPLGTRGGLLIPYLFPQDGEYEVQVRLQRDRNEQVEGLRRPHEIEVLLDRARVAHATVKPPGADKNAEAVDQHLRFRLPVPAGRRELAVTFPRSAAPVLETERAPLVSRFNMHRHPRTAPAVFQVTVTGPFDPRPGGDTPSRRRIFGPATEAPDASPASAEARARAILTRLARTAYRQPVTDDDLRRPLQFFREGSAGEGGFEAGIEAALAALLVNPRFLFRVEAEPADLPPGTAYPVDGLALASRLSFFLWGSLPDEPLLAAAERGELAAPAGLAPQVRRMLADPRAANLVTNFAAQWLHLRALAATTPDARRFIDFDDNLRQSMRRETELFLESLLREDRPVTDLLAADYTFLDERLARHYGIPHVLGSHFRRVSFAGEPARQRGGLLRHGSILTVTSYATRTSPVIRGHWILANLAGSPPPPPPPDVPSLDNQVIAATLPIRERLAQHRANPACASCHDVMDPVGFALEHFDAVGRWRAAEDHRPVDARGAFGGGDAFTGVAGLEQALLARPELLTATLAEKLLTFALGRGLGPADAPAVRAITRAAAADGYRFSSVIHAVTQSVPFRQRRTALPAEAGGP